MTKSEIREVQKIKQYCAAGPVTIDPKSNCPASLQIWNASVIPNSFAKSTRPGDKPGHL